MTLLFGGRKMSIAYKRILLKLSGEVLAGAKGTGIDNDTVVTICKSVKKISDMGVEVGIVVGGGNFWLAEQASIWTEQELTISVCLQLL